MSGVGIVKRVRPGDEIETYCGKCRQERTHQIVALNSQGQADRVICGFCQSNHLYRGRKTASRKTSASTASSPAIAQTLKTYSAKDVYSEGDAILHPKFGQGIVVEARSGKIDVKFGSSGVRTLLHAG